MCNCDNPYKSAFSEYFLRNFKALNLKKLICSSFENTQIIGELNSSNNDQFAYSMIIEKSIIENADFKKADSIEMFLKNQNLVKRLKGNGDFRSSECIEYLKEADIVVTNPPFSKFTELFSLLVKYEKKYLLIGNQNAITYKEIFPYIKNGYSWIGYHFGDMSFKVPDSTQPRKTRFWIDENGQKWRSLGNAMWLTNLDTKRKHEKLELTYRYEPSKYPKYDNFNAINVSKVKEIPMDYEGIMGVPLTYLKYHNDEQFEIIGEANHGSDNEYDLFKPKVDGKEIFKRILIKNKDLNMDIRDTYGKEI